MLEHICRHISIQRSDSRPIHQTAMYMSVRLTAPEKVCGLLDACTRTNAQRTVEFYLFLKGGRTTMGTCAPTNYLYYLYPNLENWPILRKPSYTTSTVHILSSVVLCLRSFFRLLTPKKIGLPKIVCLAPPAYHKNLWLPSTVYASKNLHFDTVIRAWLDLECNRSNVHHNSSNRFASSKGNVTHLITDDTIYIIFIYAYRRVYAR